MILPKINKTVLFGDREKYTGVNIRKHPPPPPPSSGQKSADSGGKRMRKVRERDYVTIHNTSSEAPL